MFREDWEALVNELLVLAAEQADLYADTAARLDGAAAAMCRDLAGKRHDLAEALEAGLRHHGCLPKQLDPEREAADRWIDTVRSAFSRNEGESLLHSRLAADETIDRLMAEAVAAQNLPADLRGLLDREWTALDADRHAVAEALAAKDAG